MKSFFNALLFALLSLLAATALGLAFIYLTGIPFYGDIKALNIPATSGLDRAEILENYRAVMVYLSPFSTGDFHLPTLAYTQQSIGHFADVKLFFNLLYLLGAISMGLLLLLWRLMKKAGDLHLLKRSAVLTLVVPAALSAVLAVNFDRAFVFFHSIFFEGDSWLLDPQEDAIINILPQDFFFHCALVISAFWLLSSIIQFCLHRIYKSQNR